MALNPSVWLTRFLTLQRSEDRVIIQYLEQASKDVEAQLKRLDAGKNVERAQLLQAQSEIKRVLDILWGRIGDRVKSGQARAAALAAQTSFDWDESLLRQVYSDPSQRSAMRNSLEQTAIRNVQASLARMTGDTHPLSARVYRARALSQGWLETRINSALARGINYTQLAREVRDFVRPDTPGGVAYAAKRLARTEINNAYHAVTASENRDKPWVTGMVWRTSRSHQIPDRCNLLADNSPYPKDDVPAKPHPQCMCYTYPEVLDRTQFINLLSSGQFDSYLNAKYGAVSGRVA